MEEEKIIPVIKWPGGKRRILDKILPKIPCCISGRYFEPFLGGGAVAFAVNPVCACLSDSNEELINFYRMIKEDYNHLSDLIISMENTKENFYTIRKWDRELEWKSVKSNMDRAARFYFLNHTCFNGLYRVNSKGEFNAPYGYGKKPLTDNRNAFKALAELFLRDDVDILCGDFMDILSKASDGDFVYMDPPYIPLNNTSFLSYTVDGFNMERQRQLARELYRLSTRNVRFLLSNSFTQFNEELYGNFNIEIIEAPRFVNCKADGRGNVREILVSNF